MEKLQTWLRPRLGVKEDEVAEKLLQNVWGFTSPSGASPAKRASYYHHYTALVANQQLLSDFQSELRQSQRRSQDVVDLIDKFFRSDPTKSIKEVRDLIQNDCPDWLVDDTSETVDKVWQFASRMWLFITPQTHDETATLQQSVHRVFDGMGEPTSTWLGLDFSAETLERKGGFRLVWTNDLAEHLTFESGSVIRVFSKSAALHHAQYNSAQTYYPPGFPAELRKTLDLLWQVSDHRVADKVKSLEGICAIDIEASMGEFERYNLDTYPVFGHRLERIQERLEHERQRRSNARGIQIAVWGIVVTAVLGLVSTVAGLVQMWASLQALKSS